VTSHSNLNDQEGLSASVGECRRPRRRPMSATYRRRPLSATSSATYVGDLLSATSRRRPLSAQIAEIISSTAENTYSTTRVTYRDLSQQSKRSGRLVGECRRPRRRPGRQQENSWTHLCGRIRVYSHMHDFISTLSRTHQLLRPILTCLPIFSQCYS